MRVLVTGATGFIASHHVERLLVVGQSALDRVDRADAALRSHGVAG